MNLGTRLLGALALLAMAGASASAQIALSEHNFSSKGWSGGEICKPCHTPHFAIEGMPRLWNHTLTTAAYTMHEGPGTAEDNLDVVSRMCLSCHDGTVALDSFGGQAGGAEFIGASANLGVDLTDDHVIGTDAFYPPPVVPSWWNTAMQPTTGGGTSVGSGANTLRLKSFDDNGTIRYVVGCTTCHNAHNRGNYPHMTAISNSSSTMCLVCHIK